MNVLMRLTHVALALASGVALSAGPIQAQLLDDGARVWVSRDGARRVEGTLLEISSDKKEVVLIRSDNQKQARVNVDRLSAIDYLYVQDFIRRTAAGSDKYDFESVPLAMLDDHSPTKRWLLRPAISIDPPEVSGVWKVLSSRPIFFGGFALDTDDVPMVTILAEVDVVEPAERLARIRDANYTTRLFLEERGVSEVRGEELAEDLHQARLLSRVGGQTSDGMELFCDTQLQWDNNMLLVIRAFGDSLQLESLHKTVDSLQYLDEQPSVFIDPGSMASSEKNRNSDNQGESPAADSAANEAVNQRSAGDAVPAAIRSDFNLFLDSALSLLSKSNNAQEVIENIAHPDDLNKLKQDAERWDSAIIAFDVRKRQRLVALLDSLDWSTAQYSAREKRLSFQSPNAVDFIKTNQGWRILN